VLGPEPHSIRVDLGPHCPNRVLHDRIEAATRHIPASLLRVSQVGLTVTFEPRPGEDWNRTRSFEISWPNSCSLRNDGYDIAIQRMLAENGIEPRHPNPESEDAD